MDTKKLRQKILDLAIHGKLVPQDPNDEPASVLLERIRAEKEMLIKEGKIKAPKKSKSAGDTSHYPKEMPFEVPEGWVWTTIDDIAFVTKLAGFEYTEFIANNLTGTDGVPLFKGNNVQDGKIIYKFESFIPKAVSDELPRSQVRKKCLLTPYVGTIGNIGIHDKEGFYHLGSNVGKIEILNGKQTDIYEEYVKLFLQSTVGYKELTKQKKATAQDSISIEAIREVFIPIPPRLEQQRVLQQLNHWLSFVESIEHAEIGIRETVCAAKANILDIAIHGKLVPQDPTDEPAIELLKRINPNFKPSDNLHYEGNLPKGWCFSTIGDLFQHNTGKALNGKERDGDNLRYITTSNLYWDRFDLTEVRTMPFTEVEKEKCRATKGDLLVCEGGDIGRAAIWPYDYDVMIQNHIHRLRPKTNLSVRFFYYIFLLYKQQGLIGGKGIAILGLSSRELDRMVVPVPPVEEQHRIVAGIKTLFTVLEEIQTGLEA